MIHNLAFKNYLLLFWWIITFRGYKSAYFMYMNEHKGMYDVIAFKYAKELTRKEYLLIKKDVETAIKSKNK
jgi:hypothetical protein